MTCPACHMDREHCHACAGICPDCQGRGEQADNHGWPDPQTVETYECPTCKGEGMTNPDFNTRGESYQDMVLRLTRDENTGAAFDEAFDELLARQERLESYAPAEPQSGALAPLFPPRTTTGGCFPSRPPVGEDHDERKAA